MCPGEPPIPWRQWKELFTIFRQRREFQLQRFQRDAAAAAADAAAAQQPEAYPREQKNLDLISLLGPEGHRLYMGTPNSANYDRPHNDVLAVCDGLFGHRVNRWIALDRFNSRWQRPGEKASEWCSELRVLAKDCNFPNADRENQEIVDMLVLHCHDPDLKQKLFAQHEDSTLEQILNFMSTEEQSRLDVNELKFSQGNSATTAVVKKPRKKTLQSPAAAENKQSLCDGCGKSGHKYRDKKCPAKGQRCSFCRAFDHFESVCRKKLAQQKSQATLTQSPRLAPVHVSDSRIRCSLLLKPKLRQSKPVKYSFIADSGSQATTITESDFRRLFPKLPIGGLQVPLRNFDDSPAPTPLGSVPMTASFSNDRHAEIDINVVPDNCLSLLSIDDMALLGLVIDTPSRSVYAVSSRTSVAPLSSQELQASLVREFPSLFSDGIGKVLDYEHKIQLKPDARPVKCKLRHAPYAIAEKASEAVDILIDNDVVEQAERSDWVHPAHFVWKPDKEVRTTADFSPGLNKNIIPTHHPLPLPSDIFRSVSEDKFFSLADVVQGISHSPAGT